MSMARRILWLSVALLLGGCIGHAEKPPYPGIKLGNPYQVYGRWYKPKYEADYDETGTASWYGPGFHGGHTANGEKYDQYALTGAHRTLPLPSLVRVTNLDNGKSTIVRINDRGPFAHNRIIDVSKAVAVKLDIIRTGTAKVRVQFLEKETREYVEHLRAGTAYAYGDITTPAGAPPQSIPVQTVASTAPVPGGAVTASDLVPIAAPPTEDPPQAPQPQADIFSVVDNAQAAPMNEDAEEEATPAPQPRQQLVAPPVVTPVIATYYSPPQTGGYYVQAGIFREQANANNLQQRLDNPDEAQITEMATTKGNIYRVMLGPYAEKNDAKNMLSKLALMGIPDAKIIHN